MESDVIEVTRGHERIVSCANAGLGKTHRQKRRRSRKEKRSSAVEDDGFNGRGNGLVDKDHVTFSSCKLFIGQLPPGFDEQQIRSLLKQFGKLSHLKICRDKVSGQSRRCCFVTFTNQCAAEAALKALHNVTVRPTEHKVPLQVKYVDGSFHNYRSRKIFVGMISKCLSESDLTGMFEHFGTIEECVINRDSTGQSKGSGLITFKDQKSAELAIQSMHQSQFMNGCRTAIVVKLADSRDVKLLKKLNRLTEPTAVPHPNRNQFVFSSNGAYDGTLPIKRTTLSSELVTSTVPSYFHFSGGPFTSPDIVRHLYSPMSIRESHDITTSSTRGLDFLSPLPLPLPHVLPAAVDTRLPVMYNLTLSSLVPSTYSTVIGDRSLYQMYPATQCQPYS